MRTLMRVCEIMFQASDQTLLTPQPLVTTRANIFLSIIIQYHTQFYYPLLFYVLCIVRHVYQQFLIHLRVLFSHYTIVLNKLFYNCWFSPDLIQSTCCDK